MSSMVLNFSPSWIFVLGITKFGSMRMISLKQLSAYMMAIMNFWSCHLASQIPPPHSRHWWIKYFGPTCESLFWSSLMIFSSILKHGMSISNIWILYCNFSVIIISVPNSLIVFFGQKKGVHVDPSKIYAMKKWPHPQTFKSLRGFLGLNGYYYKFVKDYRNISSP